MTPQEIVSLIGVCILVAILFVALAMGEDLRRR